MSDNAIVPVEEAKALAKTLQPMFPNDLNAQQAMQLANIALEYELDPMLGELIPYQGKPYVSVDGYLRIAGREPMYDGFDHRPATEDERSALGAVKGEVIWVAFVYRKDRSRPAKSFGRAGGPNERNPLVSGNNRQKTVYVSPHDQALTRALRRALRASFSLKLPGDEDNKATAAQIKAIHAIDEKNGIEREQRHQELQEMFGVDASNEMTSAQASAYIDGRLVDTGTGEVVDADDVVEAEVPADDDHDPHWNSNAVKRSIQQVIDERSDAESFDAPDITNWTEFWHWAKGHGFKNAASVQEAVGIESVQDHTPQELASMLVDVLDSE